MKHSQTLRLRPKNLLLLGLVYDYKLLRLILIKRKLHHECLVNKYALLWLIALLR